MGVVDLCVCVCVCVCVLGGGGGEFLTVFYIQNKLYMICIVREDEIFKHKRRSTMMLSVSC